MKHDQRKKALSFFIHEIKNPLNAIMGFSALLQKKDLTDAEKEKNIKNILEGARKIQEILDHAQKALIKTTPNKYEMNALPLIEQIKNHFTACFPDCTIDFKLAGDQTLYADPLLLSTAMMNLIENGVQATEGVGPVFVSFFNEEKSHTIICIEDRGPGLLDLEPAEVLQPFFTTKERGMGLGLTQAKEIIDAHGGSLLLEKGKKGGLLAVITLPKEGKQDGH